MIESFKEKLIEVLVKGKLVKAKDLEKALGIQKRSGGSLGKILVDKGYLPQKDLLVIVSQQLNIPPIDLSKYKIDKSLMELIPERIARQYSVIPISKIGKNITVAMADPLNIFAIDDMKTATNYKIDPVIATENDIKEAINIYYGGHAQEIAKILEDMSGKDVEIEIGEEEEKIDVSEIAEESQKAPIVKVVSLILNEALKKRASDIHIEPTERSLKVRYRIDGSLHDALTLPKKNQNAVIARIKIMSKLDITETRLPQDSRFKIRLTTLTIGAF